MVSQDKANGVGHRWKGVQLAVAVLAVVVIAGCGSDKAENQSPAAPSTAATQAPAKTQAAAGPTVASLTGAGSFEAQPPTSGPPPAKGKKVWWVSCGMVVPDCSVPANAAKEAAAKLGFDFQIADGRLNQGGGQLAAVRTALAASPDVMVIHGISCPIVKGALQDAKRKGVKLMGVETPDCSDTGSGPSLFDVEMKYAPKALTNVDYFKAWGRISAQYLIADTGGKANIILAHNTEPLGEFVQQGFTDEIKKCSGCKIIDEFTWVSPELIPGGPFIQKLRGALTKNPTADAAFLSFDGMITNAGGGKAIQETNPNVKIYGGGGQAPTLDLLRRGGMRAVTAGHSPVWTGYAAMDNVNRALNGQDTVPQGVGFRPIDKDHNLPAKPGSVYESPIDFKAAYEKSWSAR